MMQSGRGEGLLLVRKPLAWGTLLAVGALVVAGGACTHAQTPAASQTTPSKPAAATSGPAKPAVAKKVSPTRHVPGRSPSHARQKIAIPQVPVMPEPVAAPPPAPERPKWPAFDPAAAASVVWDSRGLSITATNSSLQQIMKDVAADTGTKVEGLTADQRVFGVYGPGQARDVLSQLLQGSGYNVIMIGDLGAGAPRQLLLSMRSNPGGPAQPNVRSNAGNNDDEPEAEEAPEPDRPVQPEQSPSNAEKQQRRFNQEHPPLPGQPFGTQVAPGTPPN